MKIMPLEEIDKSDLPVVTNDSPVIRAVELGVAKLNTVSHHEHLRCAKYVNPLIRQLSEPESLTVGESLASYNRNSLIVLDDDVVESDTEDDVYEDQMESKLESSFENDLDTMDESDTTISDSDNGNGTDNEVESDDKDEIEKIERDDNRVEETVKINVTGEETQGEAIKSPKITRNEKCETEEMISEEMSADITTDSEVKEKEVDVGLPIDIDSEVKENEVDVGLSIDIDSEVKEKEVDVGLSIDIDSEVKEKEVDVGLSIDIDSEVKEKEVDVGLPIDIQMESGIPYMDDDFKCLGDKNAQNCESNDEKVAPNGESNTQDKYDSIGIKQNESGGINLTLDKGDINISPGGTPGYSSEEDEDAGVAVPKTEAVDDTRNSVPEENALKVNGTSEVSENGVSEEEAVRDPNILRETHEKEEVHFAEMNNVRQKFESGGTGDEEAAPHRVSVKDEYDEGGEFENEPVQNPDVVKETDQPQEELPEVGMAKNLVNRFKSIQEEKTQTVVSQKRPSPPRGTEKVEYESQPTEHLPQYEGPAESGVFESEPKGHEDVIRSGDQTEDFKPEEGFAKNILSKFKEIETEKSQYKSQEKRELTPDRSGKVEYVSEPRGEKITYNETQSEAGVFENVPKEEEDVVRAGDKADEILPESGTAKNLLSKFKQMETEAGNKPPPSPKRDVQEKSTRSQFTHEQRGYLERYEPTVESGEFENQPEVKPEVIRSEDFPAEVLPEVGSAKKTMERFREIQKQSSSPVSSKAKEITPPREQSPGRNVAGVFESTPAERGDVVRSGEAAPEELPEQGTTRNILNRFKEIQTSGSQSTSPGKKHKEFTPPPESGVYENKPNEHLIIETREAESGILESTPKKSEADVSRDREVTPEAELPEQGMAKNLVSRWKQLESASSSAKSTSPRFKEFTPPRDSRGPLSPKSPGGVTNSVHPSDLPGQYQPQESSVIYENKPEVKEGVYRETDTDLTDGMPAPNTTASMLQRFKSIQEDAKAAEQTPDPAHRKADSPPPQPDTEEKGMFKVVQTEKCAACQKTVYAMEKLEMNGHIYHKNCFKCSHCSARLTAKTFSMNEGVIYCVNHFKQLFARKGNYDEGFGRQQYKKKWQGEKTDGATA